MDFGSLLHKAQKNEQSGAKKEIKYYSTKFEPPKKEQRSKALSANIQKFLARKEEEEKLKSEEARKRREQLLELRSKDKKATRRVNVMLKRTKSANQSVIQDAVDKDNTAITLAGPSQPDEDDYGYVSQSAADFYNKMMEKYNKMPDEPKFNLGKKKVSTNLSNTKDRVKAALDREEQEANQPHRRKRKAGSGGADDEKEDKNEKFDKYEGEKKEEKKKIKLKPAPVINFSDLLKLAEKKQFEPIVVEPKKEKEEERLLTKRQRREWEKEKELRESKERRERERNMAATNKIPKLNGDKKIPKINSNGEKERPKNLSKPVEEKSKLKAALTKPDERARFNESGRSSEIGRPNESGRSSETGRPNGQTKQEQIRRDPSKINRQDVKDARTKLPQPKKEFPPKDLKKTPKQFPPNDLKPKFSEVVQSKQFPPNDLKPKQFPPNDVRPKKFPPNDLRTKQFPPNDLRSKQFPPSDLRQKKQFPPTDMRQRPSKLKPNKGRIYDDDEEYDSEMDDFIDDGPDEEEDYSKHISEIFGYDRRKYRYVDEDDDNMESSFAQQMREEVISGKLGLMEDLEDMKLEEEQKRKKAMLKKKHK